MTALPGVLLVEDDPDIACYVQMALEELPLRLRVVGSQAAALQALADEPVALMITDLMLGADSGFALLRRLRDEPALRGSARLVAYSASLAADVGDELMALGVWRMLVKPVPLATLHACVCEALGLSAPDVAAPVSAASAVLESFGGDQALFDSYRAGCLDRFVADIHAGDRAVAAADAAALRRLGHDLRSVLQLIGEPAGAGHAAVLEQAALAGGLAVMAPAWAALRAELARMARPAA